MLCDGDSHFEVWDNSPGTSNRRWRWQQKQELILHLHGLDFLRTFTGKKKIRSWEWHRTPLHKLSFDNKMRRKTTSTLWHHIQVWWRIMMMCNGAQKKPRLSFVEMLIKQQLCEWRILIPLVTVSSFSLSVDRASPVCHSTKCEFTQSCRPGWLSYIQKSKTEVNGTGSVGKTK